MNLIVTALCIVSAVIGGSGALGAHPVLKGTDWRVGAIVGVPLGLLIGSVAT